MIEKIILRRFDDFHLHPRRGNHILHRTLSFTTQYCHRAIIMPNTEPAILMAGDVSQYQSEIIAALEYCKNKSFEPLMTIEIRDDTTPEMIEEAFEAGAVAGKIYPLGVTTNSEKGLKDFFNPLMQETFKTMQSVGMKRLLHGELTAPRTLLTGREKIFLPTFRKLVDLHPDLKTVLEHVSTKEAIEAVKQCGTNVAATITAHHPFLTADDPYINPHTMCNPVPKTYDDRDAIIEAMMSGNPKFFFGSDSAPHPRGEKECSEVKCGVFSAPVVPCVLMELFEKHGALDKLEDFTSRFGAEFYGLSLNEGTVTLIRKEWTVPLQYEFFVPFRAGKKLEWQVAA